MEVYRSSSIDWKPSPVVALATSLDESQVAAAREDGSLEIWSVSPGSVDWHCQLTIHGNSNSRVSSLAWCRSSSRGSPAGRLFSSSIDGSVSEWDLFELKQKKVLVSLGVSIWSMAVESNNSCPLDKGNNSLVENGLNGEDFNEDDSVVTSESDDDDTSIKLHEQPISDQRIALACDDGCVRIYTVTDSEKLTYTKATTRVSGEVAALPGPVYLLLSSTIKQFVLLNFFLFTGRLLCVTWSPNGDFIYYGSSDGFIRSWDTKLSRESFRITVGLGGLGSGPDLCVWSVLALRNGTLVSADSTGSVQFWDSRLGTLLQAHSCHKGDANALAAVPSHNRVFSAGSDGQIILYELSCDPVACSDNNSFAEMMKRWIYVGYVRAHSHDVRALTIAVPINQESFPQDMSTVKQAKRVRGQKKPIDTSYQKWAHLGVPMLISAGDDSKLFAYSAKEFTKFSPHDICPAPQRVPIELILNSVFDGMPILLVQASYWLDIFRIRLKKRPVNDSSGLSGGVATLDLLVRVQSKASHKIMCCTISTSGLFFAYSNCKGPRLFELKKSGTGNGAWTINKRKLPANLPYAHCMIFSFDSSQLLIAGEDKRIYVVDVASAKLVHTVTPSRKEYPEKWPPSEPPITKMFTSCDGKWLAATNCFGDIYVFDLEIRRQHWFISRLNGASVKAGGFTPSSAEVLIVSTSSNKVYAFNVKAKGCREWSGDNTFTLPRRWQDFPGEVIGLSFPQTMDSSSVIIYSARGMCSIDYGTLVDEGAHGDDQAALKKLVDAHSNKEQKRKFQNGSSDATAHDSTTNFKFEAFRDPVLFLGHLSSDSVLILDKSWMQVVKTMDAKPVHRHIFGT